MNNETMNNLFDNRQVSDQLLSIHARSSQPSSDNDGDLSSASAPTSASVPPPRIRTLKDRIKWSMSGHASPPPFDLGSTGDAASYPGLGATLTPSAETSASTAFVSKRSRSAEPTPTQFSTQQPREECVLAAASALTRLRVASPPAAAAGAAAPSLVERSSGRAFGADAFGAAAASRAAMRALDYAILSLSEGGRDLAGLPLSSSAIGPPAVVATRPMPRQPNRLDRLDEEAHSLLQTLQSLQPLRSRSCNALMGMEDWTGRLSRLNDEGAEMKRSALGQLSSENLRDDAKGSLGGVGRSLASPVGSDVPLTFPQKLMEILSNPEISDVVAWLPHGRGFVILQKQRFAAEVMPLYFKHSKFTSFTRKLNRWGFVRIARGPEAGSYYHRFFQRGNYILCMKMSCQSNNKAREAKAKDVGPRGKPKKEEASSMPPPEIETSTERPEAMSLLKLGVESPSPALVSANGKDDGRVPPWIIGGSNASARPLSPISEGCEASLSSAGRPSPPRAGGTLARFGYRQERQQEQHTGSFDRAFARQQEILLKANPASTPYRMALDDNLGQFGSGSNATPSSSSSDLPQLRRLPRLSLPEARSMQRLQHPHPSWRRQAPPPHARSNADSGIAVQNLMGANAVPSPGQPLAGAGTLGAPCSPEDEAPRDPVPSAAPSSADGAQGAAGGISEPARGAVPASSGGGDLHTAMLEKIRQLDLELKAQRAIIARGGGKAPGGDLMSQRNVAQMFNGINEGQLGRRARGDAPRPSGEQRSKRKYRAVRRASAA